jgi:hypothetical protein
VRPKSWKSLVGGGTTDEERLAQACACPACLRDGRHEPMCQVHWDEPRERPARCDCGRVAAMLRRFHFFLRDELVRLADASSKLPHERKYFIDTIVDNKNYQFPDRDGQRVVRINEETDLQHVEDLAAKAGLTFTDIG